MLINLQIQTECFASLKPSTLEPLSKQILRPRRDQPFDANAPLDTAQTFAIINQPSPLCCPIVEIAPRVPCEY